MAPLDQGHDAVALAPTPITVSISQCPSSWRPSFDEAGGEMRDVALAGQTAPAVVARRNAFRRCFRGSGGGAGSQGASSGH